MAIFNRYVKLPEGIYAFVHVDVVQKSFHNISEPFFSTIFGDSDGRTPQQKPAFFQWLGAGSGGRSSLPGPKMPMAEKKWTWWS